jgi:hypothetical protein
MIAVSWFHFVDTVRRHGGGYVDSRWPKPGSNQPQQKFSYVAGFEPWQGSSEPASMLTTWKNR